MRISQTLWLALFCVADLFCVTDAAAALPSSSDMPSLAPMLEQVTPAVVNIATYTTVQVRNPLMDDPFFRRFFNIPEEQQRYRRTQAAGSGVIVDARRGYIVTNNHVVDRADEITVTLSDGRALAAKLIGTDAQVDLAVLKVDADKLTQITFADSARLRVGDYVVAIGNPFGLDQTVTSGIVSALGRSGLGIEGYEDFIQTDASINPGNSGGALVNLRGELIGINTAILAPAGGNVGIGFAIPSNMVAAIMAQLISHGQVQRGRVGVRVQAMNAELAKAFNVNFVEGVVVVEVDKGSAAGKAGVLPGDIIVKVNDRDIKRVSDFHSQAALLMVGDHVSMTMLRDGKQRQVRFDLVAEDYQQIAGERIDSRLAGVQLENFRSENDPTTGAGILVTDISNESAAWARGLRPGDIIVAVNRKAVQGISDIAESPPNPNKELLLRVYRSGEFGYIVIP
ncbi:MAG TPA: Do family serine endopeptidase [Pseudomonadales bacterium]|nr:Do family serine endopeptidase [Pseudomonadales bacterium]